MNLIFHQIWLFLGKNNQSWQSSVKAEKNS